MELSLATRSVSDHMVLEIGGEIDVYTAPKLRERLIEMVNSGEKHVVVDLGRVEFLDSTGLGVLVGPNDEMSHVPAPGVEHHVCQLADRVVGATHRSAELEPHQ